MSNFLFLGTFEDRPYLPHLKVYFAGCTTYVHTDEMQLLSQLEMKCTAQKVTKVISTSTSILKKLLGKDKVSLADYAGSLFTHKGVEIVFIPQLRQLFTVSYGRFLIARYISKLTTPSKWREASAFDWKVLDPLNIQVFFTECENAYAIAVDIETTKVNLAIRCIGYTVVRQNLTTVSGVLPMDSDWALAWMRKINAVPAQKIFQNGKYDNIYLLRYNAPVTNWLWDTAHFMHSWYSELPKDLAFLNAFFIRTAIYWKDLAETSDLKEYYRYNALDTWATANVWITQILDAPNWAKKNYVLEFPLVYPCLLSELTGIKRDMKALEDANKEVAAKESTALTALQTMVGDSNFNPASPVQVKKLLILLGCPDIESTEEKDLNKAKLRHPLNAVLIDKILDIRGLRKLASTYLTPKELNGRILYSLNPHGTDTGRLASRESAFWCGLQIQNIPRGKDVKKTLCADEGFYLGECDLEQAESRDTANIAGDESLISAVSGDRDFHSVNASAFFGRPYETIFANGKTLDKLLRYLAKRVNHGANYNMGPRVLVDTMGLDKIQEAKRLLKLPFTDPLKIAEHLLETFHATYPAIRGKYYPYVIQSISVSSRLVSRAYHHTEYNLSNYGARDYIEEGDWTRYCFGKPDKSKSDLNAYVAHCPQSLNARTLNEAFMKVFYEIALPNPTTFRLHAQIHDSILFSYSDFALPEKVKNCMEIPVTVRDVSNIYRTFTVPAALKIGDNAKYWSETE